MKRAWRKAVGLNSSGNVLSTSWDRPVNDGEQGLLRPGWAKPDLVAALAACVAEWERALAAPSLGRGPAFYGLIQRSKALEAPSRSVGFGGVAHHLSELSRLAQASAEPGAARQQLGVVLELLASARASLPAHEMLAAQPPLAPPGLLSPPPLLSSQLAPMGVPSVSAASLQPPRFLTSAGALSPMVAAPVAASLQPAAPPAAALRPLPISGSPPAVAPSPVGNPAAPPFSHAPVPVAPSRPGQPNLLVRSVLGLRAFGRKEPTAPGTAPAPAHGGDSSSMLGLHKRSSAVATPPPALGGGYGGLPALRGGSGGMSGGLPQFRDVPGGNGGEPPFESPPPRGRSPSGDGRRSLQKTPSPVSSTSERARSPSRGRARQRGESSETRWWIGALAALGVCIVVLGIVLVAVMAIRRRDEPSASAASSSGAPAGSAVSASAPAGANSSLPRSRLLTDDERFKSLVTQVHGRGKESGELRALLEEQASTAAQALQPGCTGPACATLASVGKLVTATGKKRVKRRSHSPDALRSRWLAGLEMPELPVEDDPRVQKRFEFYTENPLGRETFQQMLFRCGAYKDAIQSALIRHGLPKDLIAVAYAESGCYPLAKSPVGAEGLWQFIPDAARAYHLRIIDGVVDERHSPQKSTDAAIQYYADLYAKFGSWDLAFSAYNVGPFGLAARLERVEGDDVGFWELVDAEMLPDETADYAPAIQAIALILNNLQRLKFGAIQQRAPQMTMDLQVPPSTRLTLVARAAALSLDELRRLNLDIQGTSTPAVPNFAVQVPKDSVWQARDTLQELLKSGDESDMCAPGNFDWGRQRFTAEMQAACARNLGARSAEAAAAPSAHP